MSDGYPFELGRMNPQECESGVIVNIVHVH